MLSQTIKESDLDFPVNLDAKLNTLSPRTDSLTTVFPEVIRALLGSDVSCGLAEEYAQGGYNQADIYPSVVIPEERPSNHRYPPEYTLRGLGPNRQQGEGYERLWRCVRGSDYDLRIEEDIYTRSHCVRLLHFGTERGGKTFHCNV